MVHLCLYDYTIFIVLNIPWGAGSYLLLVTTCFFRTIFMKDFISSLHQGNVRIFINFSLNILPSKYFNVFLTLLPGRYHVVMFNNAKSTLKHVVYINVEFTMLSNTESILYIPTKCRNNVVIFNVEFYDVDERRNNVVNMKKVEKRNSRWIIYLSASKKNHFKLNTLTSKSRQHFKIANQQ